LVTGTTPSVVEGAKKETSGGSDELRILLNENAGLVTEAIVHERARDTRAPESQIDSMRIPLRRRL
jgi:hypothetical protein